MWLESGSLAYLSLGWHRRLALPKVILRSLRSTRKPYRPFLAEKCWLFIFHFPAMEGCQSNRWVGKVLRRLLYAEYVADIFARRAGEES